MRYEGKPAEVWGWGNQRGEKIQIFEKKRKKRQKRDLIVDKERDI